MPEEKTTTTTTRTRLVALPWSGHVRQLAGDIAAAAVRATKADPGDRTDIARYERLCTQLETLAWDAATAGASTLPLPESPPGPALPVVVSDVTDPLGPGLLEQLPGSAADAVRTWLTNGHIVVALTVPFHPGTPSRFSQPQAAPGVAEPWRAPDGYEGARAVEARFRAQVAAAVNPGRDTQATRQVIDPSGVHNRVLTNVLRDFVTGTPETRVDATIAYRDGSAAVHPFPLRCLPLADIAPASADIELHLALLSIRHTDMDPVVDGAWLRNAEVSRPRPAAQTDDFVYATSLAQLAVLTDSGRRTAALHLYQTGLDSAIVGFYRAVTVHLIAHPGSLAVIPMFAAVPRPGAPDTTQFRTGSPWCTKGRS